MCSEERGRRIDDYCQLSVNNIKLKQNFFGVKDEDVDREEEDKKHTKKVFFTKKWVWEQEKYYINGGGDEKDERERRKALSCEQGAWSE